MSLVDDPRLLAYRCLTASGEALLAEASRGLAEHGLTITQFRALNLLRVRGPLSQKDVAKYVWRSVSNAGFLTTGLERARLISRNSDPNDGRVVIVSLTDRGRELLERIVPEHVAEIRRAMSGLAEAECEELLRLLEKVSPEE
ncbi:MarR family transcriptional regulator [bacterium]|nr:MAG: MarR family transcriptional regulator [bacterium]